MGRDWSRLVYPISDSTDAGSHGSIPYEEKGAGSASMPVVPSPPAVPPAGADREVERSKDRRRRVAIAGHIVSGRRPINVTRRGIVDDAGRERRSEPDRQNGQAREFKVSGRLITHGRAPSSST